MTLFFEFGLHIQTSSHIGVGKKKSGRILDITHFWRFYGIFKDDFLPYLWRAGYLEHEGP